MSLGLLFMVPALVHAQPEYIYVTNNGAITITRYTGPGGNVSIPTMIDGLPVTAIGGYALYSRSDLASLTISGSVTNIGNFAFFDCTNLASVMLGDSLTSIGVSSFYGCSSLTSVTIPGSVTEIGNQAFIDCGSLSMIAVDVHNAFYSSADGVLFNKDQTTLIQCPAGKSGNYLVPHSVTNMDKDAFYRCGSLSSVTIPSGVTALPDYPFSGCSNMTAIIVDPFNSFYSSLDGVLFDKNQTTLILCPQGKTGTYVIPESVARIGKDSFSHRTRLTEIIMTNTVLSIGTYAFYACSSLTNVAISDRVATIPIYAFSHCSKLPGVVLPNSVISIAAAAFSDCTNLTSLTIPDGVTNLGMFAFASCSNLASIRLPNSLLSIGDEAFSSCVRLTSVTIPTSVTSLEAAAFQYCNRLSNITLPGNVKTIADSAFRNCTNLSTVTIEDGVTNIGSLAFYGCTSLTNITIPKSVTTLRWMSFGGCTSLSTVTIPASITIIGHDAFYYCSRLTRLYFEGNAPPVPDLPVFPYANLVTVYYLPNTTGWTSTFADRPTMLWNPQIQTTAPDFGLHNNRFGFTVTGTTNIPILIEAATNLSTPSWLTLQSLNLTNGSCYFIDPEWTSCPARFYRIRSP